MGKKENKAEGKSARQEYRDKIKPMRRITKDGKTIKAILYEDGTYEKRENYIGKRFYTKGVGNLNIVDITYSEEYTDEGNYKVKFKDEEGNRYEFEADKKSELYPMIGFEDRKIG